MCCPPSPGPSPRQHLPLPRLCKIHDCWGCTVLWAVPRAATHTHILNHWQTHTPIYFCSSLLEGQLFPPQRSPPPLVLFDASSTVPWCPRGPGGPEGRRQRVVRHVLTTYCDFKGPMGRGWGSRAGADIAWGSSCLSSHRANAQVGILCRASEHRAPHTPCSWPPVPYVEAHLNVKMLFSP